MPGTVGCRSSCSWRRSVRLNGRCKRRNGSGSLQPESSWHAAQRAREALNLLSGESGHSAVEGRLSRALALLALVLAISAVAIPLQRQRATVAELESQVAAARADAEESLAMRDRLGVLTKSAQFLLAETRHPLVVQVLDELTRPRADQAHLIQLERWNQTVELHGFASTASDLIGLLDESPLFKAPQFRSPVTQDRRSGAERFHIWLSLPRMRAADAAAGLSAQPHARGRPSRDSRAGRYHFIVAPLLTAYRDGEARIEQAKTCSSAMRRWLSNALC